MAKKKIFSVNTLEQAERFIKRAQSCSAFDMIPKDEVKVWLLRAYGEGYKMGYSAARKAARSGKNDEPTGEAYHRKRLKQRNKFLAKLAPDLLPDDELTMTFT